MPDIFLSDSLKLNFATDDCASGATIVSDAVKKFWKETFIEGKALQAKAPLPQLGAPEERQNLPPFRIHERELLNDLAKSGLLNPHSVYSPTGFGPSERLDYLHQLSCNVLANFSAIDLNEDNALSKREIADNSYSKVMSSNPKSSTYFINNYDRFVNCSGALSSRRDDVVPDYKAVSISKRDMIALKALTGNESDLLSYARDANWAGYGGLAVNIGTFYTPMLGTVGFSISKKMGVIGVAVGLAAIAASWQLTLNRECNLLRARRKELSIDSSMDEAIRMQKR